VANPKKRPVCKDCGSWTRKLTPPGPRCATCHRIERKRVRKAAHERRVQDVYGLPAGAYDALYAAQGGKCAIPPCKATGKTKRLAVDHDHSCCSGPKSCGKCVRGLLCGPHNDMLAVARDDPQHFVWMIAYLSSPPARKVLDAAVPSVRETEREDHDGGPVVQARDPEVRRVGHTPIPGVDEYAGRLSALEFRRKHYDA